MDEVKEHHRKIGAELAWQKICKWCAFQERCQQEVRDKLYDFGLHREEVEASIARLISEGFLNEERFAIAFAGGKFRQLGWGRLKIRMALQQKKVSEYCVRSALAGIDEGEYTQKLQSLLQKRARTEKEKHPLRRKQKLAHYLISRGFEAELVREALAGEPEE